MKPELIVLLVFLFGGLALSSALVEEDVDRAAPAAKSDTQSSLRSTFKMPKLFDFEAFRHKFNKQYANAAEMARRAKVFMARALAVFVSAVKYRYGKASKFLKINPRSDWTPEERRANENHAISSRQPSDPADQPAETVAAVEPEEVERRLAEMVARKGESADYAAIAAMLEGNQGRKKRAADPSRAHPRRDLSMDRLTGEPPEPVRVSPKYTPMVPSNNPQYEPIQVISEGSDAQVEEGERVKPLADHEARQIDEQASLGAYLSKLVATLKSTAGGLLSGGQKMSGDFYPPSVLNFNHATDNQTEAQPAEPPESQLDRELRESFKPGQPDQVYLDYRNTECFLQPKDQSHCGACYVFATTALVEFNYCRQTGKLVPFSEQYAIDCGHSRTNQPQMFNGCQGGVESYVGEFYGLYGLELSADYPYRSMEQTCPYSFSTWPIAMGHTKMEEPKVVTVFDPEILTPNLITLLLEHVGPLFVSIITKDDFVDFGGGVDVLDCDLSKSSGHAMVIVGHGIEDGLEYWIIRNSHGLIFGLQGHYKMAKAFKKGCITRIGYVIGQFKQNSHHQGKSLFDQLKKRNLFARFQLNQVNQINQVPT